IATTSQPRSLLSIARLNMARSRARPSIWSFVRIDQTCLGRNGGFAPVILPRALACRTSESSSIGPAWSYSSVAEDEKHVPLVTVRALESGQLSGYCGLRNRLGGERWVAIDPIRTLASGSVIRGSKQVQRWA